jgi:hypothetical protein
MKAQRVERGRTDESARPIMFGRQRSHQVLREQRQVLEPIRETRQMNVMTFNR